MSTGAGPQPRPANVLDTFAGRLREERLKMADPETGRVPISQRRLSALLMLNPQAVYEYEAGKRLPHPLVRRELERFFPRLFAAVEG